MGGRTPMIGHHYTMSAMKHACGDRSYINHVWLVLETNGSHAVIRDPFARDGYDFGRRPQIVKISEFDWYPADEFIEAMATGERP